MANVVADDEKIRDENQNFGEGMKDDGLKREKWCGLHVLSWES